ncbi:hypothetical protein JCM5296_002487 [Sporobolomyces johnsonii]
MHPPPNKQSLISRLNPYSNKHRPVSSSPAKPPVKRPPVGAAPAAIAPPISLRRTKPGQSAAGGGSTAKRSAGPSTMAKGKAPESRRDPPQAGPSRARPQPQPHAPSAEPKLLSNSPQLVNPRPRPPVTAAGQTPPPPPVAAAGQTPPRPPRPQPQSSAPSTGFKPSYDSPQLAKPLPRPPVAAAGQTPPRPPPPKRDATQEVIEGDEPALARQAREREGDLQIRGCGRGKGKGRGRGRGRGRGGWRGTGWPAAGQGYRKHAVNGLLKLADFAAWVLVEDRAVELHTVKAAGPMKMTCYIVAPSPSSYSSPPEFAVGFRDERLASASAADLLVECVVDGIPLEHDRQIIRAWKDENQWKNIKERARKRTFTWRGRRESANSIRPFIFSPLLLTDDEDAACTSEAVLRSLGTIQLRVFRGQAGDAADPVSHDEFGAVEAPVFEESSKKVKGGAISHQAGLGPSRLEHQGVRSSFIMSPEDSADKPYAVFEFVYRSRDVLELQGIVQPEDRPATPPSPASRNSSAASGRSIAPSASVKPKPVPFARTESPALLMRNRRESSSVSLSAANSSETPKLEGVDVEVKDEPERKPVPPRDRKKKDLGVLILRDSDDSSDDDDGGGGGRAGLKVEVPSPKTHKVGAWASGSGSSRDQGKSKSAHPAPAPAPVLTSPSASTSTSASVQPTFAEQEAADLEIARLRAEIAAYKAAELAALRAERDRAAAAAIAAQERRTTEAEEKRRRDEESDGERREVEGLLCGRSLGGGRGAKRVKQGEGGEGKKEAMGKGKGKAKEEEWEEMVLSDSSD